ncbi:MAG: hypothetical protein GC129_05695 [Proteobacteria bacterium]|nr:hypothetical protein [Pseudomonadota bacterium]
MNETPAAPAAVKTAEKPAEGKKTTFYCSFCSKSQHEVKGLAAKPTETMFICNECLELGMDTLREEKLLPRGLPTVLPAVAALLDEQMRELRSEMHAKFALLLEEALSAYRNKVLAQLQRDEAALAGPTGMKLPPGVDTDTSG